jgi:hypothetical protein
MTHRPGLACALRACQVHQAELADRHLARRTVFGLDQDRDDQMRP